MRHKNGNNDELYYECEFGMTFSCEFDRYCFFFGNGGYEYGYIDTNEQLEQLINFLTEYKGKLK